MDKQRAHLENWWHNEAWNCLHGIVSGHPELRDGESVRTSHVVKLDREGRTCETKNTIYSLGEPSKHA